MLGMKIALSRFIGLRNVGRWNWHTQKNGEKNVATPFKVQKKETLKSNESLSIDLALSFLQSIITTLQYPSIVQMMTKVMTIF